MNGQNTAPFVFSPLSPDLPAIQPAPMQQEQMENLYPEIYYEVYPQIAEIVDKIIAAGYTPTRDMLDTIVDNIIKNSGMWYEDDDAFDTDAEVVPVQVGFGGMPYRRRRRRHHNRNTLRDIIRIILLQELLRSRGGHSYYGY